MPRNGLHENRVFRRVAERSADLANRAVQTDVEVDECVTWPQHALKLLAGDEVSCSLDQKAKNLKWLVRQPDLSTALSELAGCGIELKCAKARDGRWRCFVLRRELHERLLERDSVTRRTAGRITCTGNT
jgi:hypothetical protein